MQRQILIDRSELSKLIQLEVSKALKTSTPEAKTDRCEISEASQITHLSTGHIYKLKREGLIPCKKYQGRLVFSRRDLLAWMETKTIAING